ncbi:Eukaryotic aspartyl protease family protein [Zostera marina]|uniref:Eukaryotic aspartyl protease family protein n=1 Tax=Zostera marina TaxID=29655 RepID=A0A0K9Q303_ZOSMR|nr:Eukaryotic aspartyl protease family protein [Zostera marina]
MVVTRITLFFLLISSFSPLVLSRRHVSHATTATLDVSDVLTKTAQVLTFDPESTKQQYLFKQDEEKDSTTALSEFTIKLHPRDSLRRMSHKDYGSLTLSRLRRDTARVEALTARLNLANNDVQRSDLKPLLLDEETVAYTESAGGGAMQGPVVSGTSQGSGEYFSRVSIGQPPKPMYMVLDTGSDVTWVQCQPCTDCYQQADPVFVPTSSTSFSTLSCDASQCASLDISACRNSTCLYQVAYGDGSYTVGDFVTDTVTFGDSGNSVNSMAFGCGHNNQGLFVAAAGLLGLGGGPLSFPSQLSATDFSYCLVDRDSSSTSTLEFGRNGDGFSSSASSSGGIIAPLLKNKKMATFYYVGVTGMSVGGTLLSIPPSSFAMDEAGNGGIIIDSGTAVTRLKPDVYSVLRDAFKEGMTSLPSAGSVALFDTCYDLSSLKTIEVPTVAFNFPEGKVLKLPAKNYVIPVDSAGTFCFAFAPTSSSSGLSIIGNVQQQGTRVNFDIDNGHVGFAPNKC